MKKKILRLISPLLILAVFCCLTGCDPVYPPGALRAEPISPLSPGTSADVKLLYPNTGGSVVLGWTDPQVEIVSGDDVIAVSGLTVTALKPGTASIRISASTVISDESAAAGYEEKEYSAIINITVE